MHGLYFAQILVCGSLTNLFIILGQKKYQEHHVTEFPLNWTTELLGDAWEIHPDPTSC